MSALVELLPKTVDGLILSAPLVPPTLDGRKTCTRRMSKKWLKLEVGDLLFVRENWRLRHWAVGNYRVQIEYPEVVSHLSDVLTCPDLAWHAREVARCQAFAKSNDFDPSKHGPLRPSIFLPKWASRCVLRITEKPRLERVQDITEEDAKREGVERGPACDERCETPHRCGFIDVWHRLHTKPGERWADNPSVVRLAFERVA